MKKKILSILLAAVTMISVLPMGVLAAESTEEAPWSGVKEAFEQANQALRTKNFLKIIRDYPKHRQLMLGITAIGKRNQIIVKLQRILSEMIIR